MSYFTQIMECNLDETIFATHQIFLTGYYKSLFDLITSKILFSCFVQYSTLLTAAQIVIRSKSDITN